MAFLFPVMVSVSPLLLNPHLAMMHAIFTKFHNLVAEQLRQVNPHWDHNRIFKVSALNFHDNM